jgi:hypothetical protein
MITIKPPDCFAFDLFGAEEISSALVFDFFSALKEDGLDSSPELFRLPNR